MTELMKRVFSGEPLNFKTAKEIMEYFISGDAPPEQIAGFLGVLSGRKETAEEIYAIVSVMRDRCIKVDLPKGCENAVDLCGTGGDGAKTFNISTAVSFVVAGAGVPVAKHGNRSVSSKSGSIDVLEALGIKINLSPEDTTKNILSKKFGVLFAQNHHPAMKAIAPVRRSLGVPTVFNLLGPMLNPAGVKRQVMGVFDGKKCEKIAQAYKMLGAKEVMVIHSKDNLDEFSIENPTDVYYLKDNDIKYLEISPEDAGLNRGKMSEIPSGVPEENAKTIVDILTNKLKGVAKDIVILNASAAFQVAGVVPNMKQGAELAANVIDSGKAYGVLEDLRK